MTDRKKKEKGKSGAKSKKLQLNKEALKDLGARERAAKGIKGGQRAAAAPTRWDLCG